MNHLKIIEYHPKYQSDFYKINAEWVSEMFIMERWDEDILANPDFHILAPGGKIWFAEHDQLGVVGTCALMKTGPNEFELTKMGVLKSARGLKAGQLLLEHVITYAHSQKIENLYLLTNRKCETAIHLYERYGFEHDPSILTNFGEKYSRCDVAMKWRNP